jgi:acyl-CoA reductase-like NAD-dependent aldehyde dehydrogenase
MPQRLDASDPGFAAAFAALVADRRESDADVSADVAAIIAAGIIPAGLEMMDRLAIQAAEAFVHAGYPLDCEALLLCEVDGEDHPFVQTELLMPVLPLVRVKSVEDGIDAAVRAEHGFGHTAAMYSTNIDALHRMARAMDCSIFVKNAPTYAGLGLGERGPQRLRFWKFGSAINHRTAPAIGCL